MPGGCWRSVYDGAVLDAASAVDIGMSCRLMEAWRSGASQWTTADRRAFAYDLAPSRLIAVSARSNRAKSGRDLSGWRPDLAGFRCTCVRALVCGSR